LTQTDDPSSLNFADLCTLANCSVLIMTDKYHGYYIHGKAPWLKSDLPMSWLKMELDMEGENRRRTRAIASDSMRDPKEANKYGNTYEIFLQPNFRSNFDSWRDTPLEQMDNRNLSDKEKSSIEEQTKAIMLKKARKDGKVVKESDEFEVNDQGLN